MNDARPALDLPPAGRRTMPAMTNREARCLREFNLSTVPFWRRSSMRMMLAGLMSPNISSARWNASAGTMPSRKAPPGRRIG